MPCSVLKLPGGGAAIVRHGKPRRRCCAFCRLTWDGLLCDYPVGDGKTCDKPLCNGHARQVGPDLHYCHDHPALPEGAPA